MFCKHLDKVVLCKPLILSTGCEWVGSICVSYRINTEHIWAVLAGPKSVRVECVLHAELMQ